LHFAFQRRATGGRQHVQPDGEDELQHQTEEEHRRGVAQDGEGADAGVRGMVAVPGRDASQADADDQCDDQCQEREFEGGRAISGEDGDDLLVIGQRGAEVAVEQVAEVVEILHDERTVVSGRVDALMQLLRRESATKRRGNRIAGGSHHEEDDGYKNEDGRNDQQKAGKHETEESAGKLVPLCFRLSLSCALRHVWLLCGWGVF